MPRDLTTKKSEGGYHPICISAESRQALTSLRVGVGDVDRMWIGIWLCGGTLVRRGTSPQAVENFRSLFDLLYLTRKATVKFTSLKSARHWQATSHVSPC
jgi:hypothetical protein